METRSAWLADPCSISSALKMAVKEAGLVPGSCDPFLLQIKMWSYYLRAVNTIFFLNIRKKNKLMILQIVTNWNFVTPISSYRPLCMFLLYTLQGLKVCWFSINEIINLNHLLVLLYLQIRYPLASYICKVLPKQCLSKMRGFMQQILFTYAIPHLGLYLKS